ncbi:MAG: ABC transporter permease [Galbitalea sp.]
MRAWTGFVGAVLEAWQELRIHRTRVLLSLIGVAVAVCSITAVVAFAAIAEEGSTEQNEANGGQPANLRISVSSTSDTQPTYAELEPAFQSVIKRYGIRYASANEQTQLDVQFTDGAETANITLVDPAFATMHVISLAHGRWLDAADATRLAPAVVVNPTTYAELGSPDLRSHPVVHLLGSPHTVAVVVGVTRGQVEPGDWGIYMLPSAFERVAGPSAVTENSPAEELWVPPEVAKPLATQVESDLTEDFAGRWEVSVDRQDYLSYQHGDPLFLLKLVVGGNRRADPPARRPRAPQHLDGDRALPGA